MIGHGTPCLVVSSLGAVFVTSPERLKVKNTFNSTIGKSRGIALWRGNWGCPPIFKFPHDWGIQGVDTNNLI